MLHCLGAQGQYSCLCARASAGAKRNNGSLLLLRRMCALCVVQRDLQHNRLCVYFVDAIAICRCADCRRARQRGAQDQLSKRRRDSRDDGGEVQHWRCR